MTNEGFAFYAIALSGALWVGMLICAEIGRRMGLAQLRRLGKEGRAGVGVVDGAVYGMLAFLIGFSFSGAAGRLDHRRELVAAEVDAIGSAWEQLELLPSDQQSTIRPLFRRYYDQLLDSYADTSITSDDLLEPPALTRAQAVLWSSAVAACLAEGGERARMLVLPAFTQMFDSVELERLARRIHPPVAIFVILAVIALLAAVFAGNALAQSPTRSWLYTIGLATTIAVASWATLELEFPRLGVIRVNSMDRALVELRQQLQ